MHIKGCQVIIKKKNVFFCLKVFFTLTNSVDPDEFILAFTVCKSTCLRVSLIHRVKC